MSRDIQLRGRVLVSVDTLEHVRHRLEVTGARNITFQTQSLLVEKVIVNLGIGKLDIIYRKLLDRFQVDVWKKLGQWRVLEFG